MRILRTLTDLTQALVQPLDPPLREALEHHKAVLDEFGEDLALIVIAEGGDTLSDIEASCGHTLVTADTFAFPVETIIDLSGWCEVTWIISDDGFGLVLYIENSATTDARLLAALRKAGPAPAAGND